MTRLRTSIHRMSSLALALAPCWLVADAWAQSWPHRDVRLILPVAQSSGTDVVARLIAERLARSWTRSVAVENRPGSDSVVAITTMIGAADDHTLLWSTTSAIAVHPYAHARMPYDGRTITPIAQVSNALVSITVPASLKPTTLADLVVFARGSPGKLSWASVGGLGDLLFQAFARSAGLDMQRVLFRDALQAAGDVGEGRAHVFTSAYAVARPLVESGRLRPLAFTNARRAPVMPGVPTVREAGYPALELDGVIGIFGTRGVSEEARRRIAGDIAKVLADTGVNDRLAAAGQVASPGDGTTLTRSLEAHRSAAAAAAATLGIKPAE